ncbi:MAG: hypothetical protein KKF62_17820 [Bacteroidetes bacterium]|nr:hypothetical protein [Bacteroidota bacterium]MBU1116663.1 hypothetical protein [Bacteroidota bacterium]MBU1797486.1 hypothetical protein [Bacteroidota bacterium]
MEKQNEFYEERDNPSTELSKKMWNNIENNIEFHKKEFSFTVERKSFFLGFSAAAVFVIIVFNLYAFLSNIAFSNESEIIKINRTYSKTINGMERILPAALFSESKSVNIDEELSSKLENLNYVNQAITDLQADFSYNDVSMIKQERLRALYKMKLEVLESLILMEEK